ncbi:MAG: hypothetical protein M3014_00290, partial [Chloroflexota bacterium]|nr:hypothetical protein [Chloroflexota bacterium]
MDLLEVALNGGRLLYAYTMYIDAPLTNSFRLTGEPDYWARNFDGDPLPNLRLVWEGKPYKQGSLMVLAPVRKDGTVASVGSVRMELLEFQQDREISFRFLNGSHLVYRFVYEAVSATRTEFTVNVVVDAQSPPLNILRQRLYAKRRRKASIKDHMR